MKNYQGIKYYNVNIPSAMGENLLMVFILLLALWLIFLA